MDVNDLINILIEQNKSFIEQNKAYKDMLFFGIGSIITILVIFLTANFFTMKKFREEEKRKLISEILLEIEKNNISKIKEENQKYIQELVHLNTMNLSKEINDLKYKHNSLKDDLQYFKGEQLENEAEEEFESENYGYAIFKYRYAIEAYAESGNKFAIENALENLESAVLNMKHSEPSYIQYVNEILKIVPKDYKEQVERIKSHLTNILVKEIKNHV